MRVTRSASASLKRPASPGPTPTPTPPQPAQGASTPASTPATAQRKRAKKVTASKSAPVLPTTSTTSATAADSSSILFHPPLTFSYSTAKAHLSSLDTRWATLMDKLKCTPFEFEKTEEGEEGTDPSPFDPFRSLVGSIIGQQVSWLAARSIQHKFVRLFYPHLPEKRDAPTTTAPIPSTSPFPTPSMVLALGGGGANRTAMLRGAGLSGRKVEYILDLAERFSDGRLCANRLWEGTDEEVMEELIAVRGIGIWTVQMFLIFSSKRPNILPVGDLGIQKALCRWYADDPSTSPAIHARKLQKSTSAPAPKKEERESTPTPTPSTSSALVDPLSTPAPSTIKGLKSDPYPTPSSPSNTLETLEAVGVADLAPSAEVEEAEQQEEQGEKPNPFVFPTTSNNLTPAVLRSRLNGKKLKGNIYLTPTEMTELTAPWEPFRSVACWYLWSVVDGVEGK